MPASLSGAAPARHARSGPRGQPQPGPGGQPRPGPGGQPQPGPRGQPRPGPGGQPRPGSRGRHVSGVRLVRRPLATAAMVAGLMVVCAAAAGLTWASQSGRSATPLGHTPVVPVPRGRWAPVPRARAGRPVAAPESLYIPAIGVRTRLVRLGLTKGGTLQVPSSAAVAGWYTGSPRPGQVGAAVIAGHVDSYLGPGVFFRLRALRRGELVYVRRADGSLAVFAVTAVHTFLKTRFPTAEVYAPVPNAQLRLITCGGTFDPATGHYLSNVIVFATLTSHPRHGKAA
jgi:sortase (surface protein transpeptidase)